MHSPLGSSVPQAAIANLGLKLYLYISFLYLLDVITRALFDTSVTPVGVPVVGKVTLGKDWVRLVHLGVAVVVHAVRVACGVVSQDCTIATVLGGSRWLE